VIGYAPSLELNKLLKHGFFTDQILFLFSQYVMVTAVCDVNEIRTVSAADPSMMSLLKSAGRSHTGHIHVGFFSFIIKYVAAS